jgi:F-type H+-transporting ATPase subunit delta
MKAAPFKDAVVVKRYAEAFFGVLKKARGFDVALRECQNLKNIIRANEEFLQFLLSPEIAYTDKGNFIERVLGDDFCIETKNFLKYLLEKERMERAENILDYITLNYAHEGAVSVLLRTTYPVDLDMLSEIEEKLSRKFRQKLRFFIELDGSLLGGIQVVIGNKVIDGSIRRQLEDLKQKMERAGMS